MVAAVGLDVNTRTDRSQRPRVTVRVTGVPEGVPVRLEVTARTGGFHEHGAGGCTRSGRDYTCTATDSRSTFFFHTDRAGGSASFDLRVAVPDGYTDPDPGDNTASVTLSPDGTTG